jgi:hypothetical protein
MLTKISNPKPNRIRVAMERSFSNFISVSLLKPKTFDFQRLSFQRFCERCGHSMRRSIGLGNTWPGARTEGPGMVVDIALYALDDTRHFGLHDVAVGPVESGGRPALKGLWVNGQQVVADDVLRGVAGGGAGGGAEVDGGLIVGSGNIVHNLRASRRCSAGGRDAAAFQYRVPVGVVFHAVSVTGVAIKRIASCAHSAGVRGRFLLKLSSP